MNLTKTPVTSSTKCMKLMYCTPRHNLMMTWPDHVSIESYVIHHPMLHSLYTTFNYLTTIAGRKEQPTQLSLLYVDELSR